MRKRKTVHLSDLLVNPDDSIIKNVKVKVPVTKMWTINFDYEGESQFPEYVFSTKEKAAKFLKNDEWAEWGEVVEMELDP